MDKQIQKLKKLVDTYLNHSREEIKASFGTPLGSSDNGVWFYNSYHLGVFRDEIAFIFEQGRVADIIISEFFLWILISNTYYFEGEQVDYKVNNCFGKTKCYSSGNE